MKVLFRLNSNDIRNYQILSISFNVINNGRHSVEQHFINKLCINKHITALTKTAFYYSYIYTHITLPMNIKEIREYCLFGSNVLSISLNEGLKYIAEGAFDKILLLKSIKLPSAIKTLGKYSEIPKMEII